MIKIFSILLTVFIGQISYSQEVIVLGHVYDTDTKEIIAFANFGLFVQDSLVNSSISDIEGLYYLQKDIKVKKGQTLYFIVSINGYEEKKVFLKSKKSIQIINVYLNKS